MCQREYSLSSQLQFVSSGLFQEEPLLSLSFTAASVAKKNVEGHHLLLENESERDKSSESKSYIFYTYSIISGKASTKTTSAETVILRLLSKVKQSQLASNDLRGQLNH